MRAKLSIVIPILNAQNALPACLMALIEGLENGVLREVVVSDGGSSDNSVAMAGDAGAVVVTGAAGRGGQLARGAQAAGGGWVLFLHADTVLAQGWSDVVAAHMAAELRAGYFELQFDAKGLAPLFVAGWANLRSRLFGLPYGDQGLLISRKMYDAVGGYKDMALMEDVAMARGLKRQLKPLDHVAVTSAARYQKAGWMRRGMRNLWTLARYFAGVDVDTLARNYRR